MQYCKVSFWQVSCYQLQWFILTDISDIFKFAKEKDAVQASARSIFQRFLFLKSQNKNNFLIYSSLFGLIRTLLIKKVNFLTYNVQELQKGFN